MRVYVFNSACWSFLGLIVGYMLGRWKRDRTVQHNEDSVPERKMTTPERLRRRQFILGIIVMVLALLSTGEYLYAHSLDVKQRSCLQRVVQKLDTSLTDRTEISDRQSKAIQRVILRVARAKSSDQVRHALDSFVRTQQRLNQERRQHPIPPFPRGTCEQ